MIGNVLAYLGVRIENNKPPPPGIDRVETAVAISRIFNGDAERQQLDHLVTMQGGPRISNNDASLGRHRGSRLGAVIDWLF